MQFKQYLEIKENGNVIYSLYNVKPERTMLLLSKEVKIFGDLNSDYVFSKEECDNFTNFINKDIQKTLNEVYGIKVEEIKVIIPNCFTKLITYKRSIRVSFDPEVNPKIYLKNLLDENTKKIMKSEKNLTGLGSEGITLFLNEQKVDFGTLVKNVDKISDFDIKFTGCYIEKQFQTQLMNLFRNTKNVISRITYKMKILKRDLITRINKKVIERAMIIADWGINEIDVQAIENKVPVNVKVPFGINKIVDKMLAKFNLYGQLQAKVLENYLLNIFNAKPNGLNMFNSLRISDANNKIIELNLIDFKKQLKESIKETIQELNNHLKFNENIRWSQNASRHHYGELAKINSASSLFSELEDASLGINNFIQKNDYKEKIFGNLPKENILSAIDVEDERNKLVEAIQLKEEIKQNSKEDIANILANNEIAKIKQTRASLFRSNSQNVIKEKVK